MLVQVVLSRLRPIEGLGADGTSLVSFALFSRRRQAS